MPKPRCLFLAILALVVPLAISAGCSDPGSDRADTSTEEIATPEQSGADGDADSPTPTGDDPVARKPATPPNGTDAPAAAQPAADGRATSPQTQYQVAPDFELANVAGGSLKLSDLSGKVVLLDFWATWCGPCRVGIPHLNELYSQNREEGFEIVGISVDRGRGGVSGVDTVRGFLMKTRMDYPIVMGDAQTVTAYGGIRSIPTAFLIDREGRLRKRYVGLQHKSVFERDVQELLAEEAGDSI